MDKLFTHHAPSPEQIEVFQEIRAAFKKVGKLILEKVPNSEQRYQAIHFLHMASMLSNAGIALNSHEFVKVEKDEDV